MADVDQIPRTQLALYAVAAIVIGLVGAHYLRQDKSTPAATSSATGAQTGGRGGGGEVAIRGGAGGPALVDVTGAVRRPGVVRLPASARVQDAVRRAGGATAEADLAGVNLAAKTTDGTQVVVPRRGQMAASGSATSGTAGTAGASGAPVNLNTATAEQLDQLDGVGPSTAQKIVLYRQQHGGFSSVGDLDRIPGIGPKKIAALRSKVTV